MHSLWVLTRVRGGAGGVFTLRDRSGGNGEPGEPRPGREAKGRTGFPLSMWSIRRWFHFPLRIPEGRYPQWAPRYRRRHNLHRDTFHPGNSGGSLPFHMRPHRYKVGAGARWVCRFHKGHTPCLRRMYHRSKLGVPMGHTIHRCTSLNKRSRCLGCIGAQR